MGNCPAQDRADQNCGVPHVEAFRIGREPGLALAACQDDSSSRAPRATWRRFRRHHGADGDEGNVQERSRSWSASYKKESELEVWKRGSNGKYALLKTYPICRWSGQLGPKIREGDRQVPEGFYTVTPGQMNPNSAYYLSFDTGYPNAYDRSFGRTGGDIMVHGSCSSRGCFAMTDQNIAEIYASRARRSPAASAASSSSPIRSG